MEKRGVRTYEDLRRWSDENREQFWELMVDRLGVRFSRPPSCIVDPSSDVTCPRWLVDARLNIADSCLDAPADATAIVYRAKSGATSTWSYGKLLEWTNRVANGLVESGFEPGHAIGVCLPMTAESVAIYLGIIKAGCVAVSIADSFAPDGIAARLKLGQATGAFTQDHDIRGRKPRPLYEKVVRALAPTTVVVPSGDPTPCELRETDRCWEELLSDNDAFDSVARAADDHTNILFSPGTTGEPKAIPWTQTTPIKCAADAYLHHNIQPGDVLAWPTNLGWMMVPWLIYASLINRASMALYYFAPTGRAFCEFVQDANVTMLGVVPSLVKTWRNTKCAEGLDWSSVKAFSSTGECSYPDDMLYLMSLAGYRPIIEYCGGIKISSAEVERVLNSVDGIRETGAISVAPADGGLERLVVYVVPEPLAESCDRRLKVTLQQALVSKLNSLFRIHDLIIVDALPRTASNKVMRRELRRRYLSISGSIGRRPTSELRHGKNHPKGE